jgi:acetyl-CoA carboxylase biotin carboxyl carrier protein
MSVAIEQKLKELLEFAKDHTLAEVTWQEGDQKISFRRSVSEVQVAAPEVERTADEAPAAEEEAVVRSPMISTFRRTDSKNHPPFVMEGNHIKPGDRVGLVECMKIPNDVTSYCDGVIKKILVEDGAPVEYGQPLFVVRPSDTNGAQN